MLSDADIIALWVTLKLGVVTTGILVVVSTPVAWWIVRTRYLFLKDIAVSLITMPMVLPPTVLGFYLLVLMGPEGVIGKFVSALNLPPIVFSFPGLVVGSVIFSLPLVVQSLQTSFESVSAAQLDAASTLGAGKLDRFLSIVLPASRHGYFTAAVLGFGHTIGEFGVILMIGGSIPGHTKVLSMVIYEHVESLEYANAHMLSLLMLMFAFGSVLLIQLTKTRLNRRPS